MTLLQPEKQQATRIVVIVIGQVVRVVEVELIYLEKKNEMLIICPFSNK